MLLPFLLGGGSGATQEVVTAFIGGQSTSYFPILALTSETVGSTLFAPEVDAGFAPQEIALPIIPGTETNYFPIISLSSVSPAIAAQLFAPTIVHAGIVGAHINSTVALFTVEVVGPTLSIAIEVGLHSSSFRDALINESFVEGCWPLAELRRQRFADITGHGHHGSPSGPLTSGTPNGLPEGGLGITLDGTNYILVPNAANLSLANGDMDVVCLFKTTHNSATLRCIGGKQDTSSAGNGWFLGLQSGALVGFLRVGGSTVFNFSRGSVADGQWHLAHLCYETGPGEARILIDGVQSGATVTGVTTEPGTTAADMKIGMFTDDTGGFIGSISYFTIGREGNQALSATLQPLRLWTDITEDTRSAVPMSIRYGINGSSPLDNTASTGECRVALDNSQANSAHLLGLYSFDHANLRAGFRKGSPLRVAFSYNGTTYYKHVGRVATASATPGRNRERLVTVTSVDWIDVAASSRLTGVQVQDDLDSDDVARLAIDEASRPPHAVDISAGIETFGQAFDFGDGRRETVLSEWSRVNTSERGYGYIKGDTVQGGVVVFESRADRQVNTALQGSFGDGVINGLSPESADKPNTILVTVYPRVAGSSAVLFSMTDRQPIPPLTTVEILVDYRDPSQTSVIIGGKAMVTPVATTDYTMTESADGSGIDMTAYASVAETGADLGGTATSIHVTNSHTNMVGYFKTQLRGTPVRHENPVTVPVFDPAIVRRDGASEQPLDLSYISSTGTSQDVGEHVLALYEAGKIRSISFNANRSFSMMVQALAREPGDRIGVTETMQSGSVERAYAINHVSLTVSEKLRVDCTWTLAPVLDSGQLWIMGLAGSSELGASTVLGL